MPAFVTNKDALLPLPGFLSYFVLFSPRPVFLSVSSFLSFAISPTLSLSPSCPTRAVLPVRPSIVVVFFHYILLSQSFSPSFSPFSFTLPVYSLFYFISLFSVSLYLSPFSFTLSSLFFALCFSLSRARACTRSHSVVLVPQARETHSKRTFLPVSVSVASKNSPNRLRGRNSRKRVA